MNAVGYRRLAERPLQRGGSPAVNGNGMRANSSAFNCQLQTQYFSPDDNCDINEVKKLPCNLLKDTSLESATFLLLSSLVRSTMAVVLVALPVKRPPMAVASDGRTLVTTLCTSGDENGLIWHRILSILVILIIGCLEKI